MYLAPTFWVSIVSWAMAQLLKFILVFLTSKKFDFSRFVGSGGMPSSHSALVCSLTTMVGFEYGFDSTLFAVCIIMSVVVMYDASGVRRAAGEQAKVLNKMLENWETDSDDMRNVHLKELLGHTPIQVIAGAVLGICIALLYIFNK